MSRTSVDLEGALDAHFVDTHCHLDSDDFSEDLPEVLRRSQAAGVREWINVGYEPSRWDASVRLRHTHPGMAFMLGVHPGHAAEWTPAIAADLEQRVATDRPLAIGEIGLDFYRGETNVEQQRTAFTDQLEIARTHGLPAVIHMRSSELETLAVMDDGRPLPTLLFHSFDGSPKLGEWIIQHGGWIGVGGLSTRTASKQLRTYIGKFPQDRVVLETDSPYLVPNGYKHRRNTPESIPVIARSLAMTWGVSVGEVGRVTTANAHRLFGGLCANTSS